MGAISETETVIKKILPYLVRRGYDLNADLTFEYPAAGTTRASLGFVDVLVRHNSKVAFLVEAKRAAKTLVAKDRKQAIDYGLDVKAPFVVLTNGEQFESINPRSGSRILWDGLLTDKIPSKDELPKALKALVADPLGALVSIKDSSIPYRPGLTLKQLNALFARCHNAIRRIEKNEDHAFSDFSKLLFLKLLEEKADIGGPVPPYSYRFHELAKYNAESADQIKIAIVAMLDAVRSQTAYGDVLTGHLHLKQPKTFQRIVTELSSVSFIDSRTDSKGAAFEYFVRATLKGKKLGQYFTPRPLVELVQELVGPSKIYNSVLSGDTPRVIDPACGTGGFLVFFMLAAIEQAQAAHKAGQLTHGAMEKVVEKLKANIFFGSDAHEGVASSAKMNMIIAGDGHSNIRWENSLASNAQVWGEDDGAVDLIITNPPFGTSETDALDSADLKGGKGQALFLRRMMKAAKPGAEICTVIDEGLLNTEGAKSLRRLIMEECLIVGVTRLPDVTFKPNKINVRTSLLHLRKRLHPCPDLDDQYVIPFFSVATLGYDGTGAFLRGQPFDALREEVGSAYRGVSRKKADQSSSGSGWEWFSINSGAIYGDGSFRLDHKYWHPTTRNSVENLKANNASAIKQINTIQTRRGKSPPASSYVDEEDGFALVVKAGSNIDRYGKVLRLGDFVEKDVFDEYAGAHLKDGDVILSSTGDGTLGKCAVYRSSEPAMGDGHVAIIRVDQKKVYPEYLCDYLRHGFGNRQIVRLYTGSTGLIELQPDQVDNIVVDLPKLAEQKQRSDKLRMAEDEFRAGLETANEKLKAATSSFNV